MARPISRLNLDEVIREVLAGNREQFRVIVQEYDAELLRMAYHFVHDWDDAEDITQLTFIACYRNLRRFSLGKPFRPWLIGIHLNQCRSALRWRARRQSRFVALEEHDSGSSLPEANDERIIHRCIRELSVKQQTAFVLIEIENYSPQEAAEMMKCAPSTVRVHLTRARRNLQNKLRKLGLDDGTD